MRLRVDPILRRHGVEMYICGHIHTFQHVRRQDCDIDYVLNSSASQSRKKVKEIEGTVFCSPVTGFSVLTATPEELTLYMIDREGEVVHTINRKTRNPKP